MAYFSEDYRYNNLMIQIVVGYLYVIAIYVDFKEHVISKVTIVKQL